MNRRRFLRGVGSAIMVLPFLESSRQAKAGVAKSSLPFAVFMRQGNGVQQATSTTATPEPESFWPSFAPGGITRSALAADTSRAVSVLADHAAELSIVRGIRFNDLGNACKHSSGGNQVLTAAKVSLDDCNSTKALGESLDNRIAIDLGSPGDEPLTLYAGRKTGKLDEVLSYRGARELRGAERNPAQVYDDLFWSAALTPAERAQLGAQRKSINDLVRSDMQRLLARSDLSKSDRERLDLHFTSIHDFETKSLCFDRRRAAIELDGGVSSLDDDDNIETVVKYPFRGVR